MLVKVSEFDRAHARNSGTKDKGAYADVAQFFDMEATEDGFHNTEEEDEEEDGDDADGTKSNEAHVAPITEDNTAAVDDETPSEANSDGSGHSAHSLALRDAKPAEPGTSSDDGRLETNTKETTDGASSVVEPVKAATSKEKGTLVQAKLAKPDGSKGTDWGYADAVNGRINIARAMASAKTDTYAFAKVPANLTWSKVNEADKDPYYAVSVAGTQKPIKLWGVGNVTRTYFFTASGDPPFSVSANVRLIHDNDNTVANTILAHHAAPRLARPLQYTDVRFGKWMAVRHEGDTMMTNDTFADVYDARQGIKLPKTKMDHYPPQNLKKGDLVLVEATVLRYHPKVGGRADPKKWNATYSLEFIALLSNSPPPTTLAAKICDEELVIDF